MLPSSGQAVGPGVGSSSRVEPSSSGAERNFSFTTANGFVDHAEGEAGSAVRSLG